MMSHIRIAVPNAIPHSCAEAAVGLPELRCPAAGRPAPAAAHWWDAMGRWLARSRERDEMQRLDERERRDAGLTSYDVAYESRKPFWCD